MGIAIVVEAILSFVGLSVSSGVPTWGGIIQEGRLYVNQAWWLMALPMACIVVAVLGLNALGDGLREALDPVEIEMTALLDIRDLDLCLNARPSVRLLRRVSFAVTPGRSSGWSENPVPAKPW